MFSTRKIKKALIVPFKKKDKEKPVKLHDSRRYYFKKMEQYHNNNIINAADILQKLIKDAIPVLDRSEKNSFDFQLATLMEEAEKKEKIDFIFSLIALLNKHHSHIVDETLISLLSAFFSVYNIYQLHLSDSAQAILMLTNEFDRYVAKKIDEYIASKDKDSEESLARLLTQLAKKDLLTEIPIVFVLAVLSKFTHDKHTMGDNAKLLASIANKIPAQQMGAVIKKIITTTKHKNLHSVRAACILIRSFFSLMDEHNQQQAIQYLIKLLSGKIKLDTSNESLYRKKVLKTLNKIVMHVDACHHHDIIKAVSVPLKEKLTFYSVKTSQSHSFPLKILLQLRSLSSNEHAAWITSLLNDFISDDDNHACLSLEWKHLTQEEQTIIANKMIEYLKGKDKKNKKLALERMGHIGDLSSLDSKKQKTLYSCLYKCLACDEKKGYSNALQTLLDVALYLPKKWNKRFSSLLTKIHKNNCQYITTIYKNYNPLYDDSYNVFNQMKEEKNNPPKLKTIGLDLQIMAKLSLTSSEKASSLASKIVNAPLLFEDLWLDLLGFGVNYQVNMFRSLMLLRDYIPEDAYTIITKKFIERLKENIDCDRYVFYLSRIIEAMPNKIKAETAKQLVQIGLYKNGMVELFIPYIESLSYDYKISLLHMMIRAGSENGELVSALYASCRRQSVIHHLEHVRVHDAILPNEVIENIMRFT
jgi:hypothetical protein